LARLLELGARDAAWASERRTGGEEERGERKRRGKKK
jgi:hypothetical protein